MLLTRIFNRARPDRGAAMIAVIGLMAIGLILTSVVMTSVVSSIGVTTGTRAGVQSQAAAEAGVAAARAGLAAGTCSSQGSPPAYTSSTSPIYVAEIWRPDGSGGWDPGCPVGTSTEVRILSTGYADAPGVAGVSASDSTQLEAVLSAIATSPPGPIGIEASGPAVYAYSSAGFGGGGTLYSVDGTSPDVMVKTGNVTCNGGAAGVGDLIVNNGTLRIEGGCDLDGNAWSSGRTTLIGGATVGGNVVADGITHGGTRIYGSVWSSSDVTINGGGRLDGTATAQSLNIQNGDLYGRGWIYGNTTLTWSSELFGPLTTRSITKPNNASFDNDNVHATITVLPGGLGGTTYSTPPTMPIVPNWYNFAYDPSAWEGFTEVPMSGSCTFSQLQDVVTAFGSDAGLVDARSCTNGISISGGDKLNLGGDLAIVANRFSFTEGGGFQADDDARLWTIIPDANASNTTPDCPSGGSYTISGGFDFTSNIRTLIYTPCAVTIASGIDTFRGQVFAGSSSIGGGANLGYAAVGLPGVDLSTGSTAVPTSPPATPAGRELISLRNVQE